MEAKIKKIDKKFLITDSSLNVYGFRLMTTGYQVDEFQKNPIGYYMHNREDGVVVKWEDLTTEGDKVYGKPCINLSNPRGQQCVDEIENGFLNGASVGHIVALEYSEDPTMMLAGQMGPTITKWYNRECSLCDVPGNMNALALYDKDGNEIKLSDFTNKKIQTSNMKEIKLTAAQIAKLNLTDASTEADVNTKIDNLMADAAKVPQLTQDLSAANTAKKTAEDALAALKGETITAMIDQAVKETRCTKEAGEMLKKQFEGKPTELKALLDTMKPYQSVVTQLSGASTDADKAELAELMKLSGAQLFSKEGAFERLKVLDLASYKVKYKECFDAEPPVEDKE